MKRAYPILSARSILYGGVSGGFCFLSRTLFGNPLGMIYFTEGKSLLPSLWLFNILSVAACGAMGMSLGWVIDHVANGNNTGQRSVCVYRGALFLSFAFFLFVVWFPTLFFGQRLFVSLVLSVAAMICSLICAFEWSRVLPTRASVVIYADTVWMFYITLVSLSIWWKS